MIDPEEIFSALCSGRPSVLRADADTVGDAIKKVENASEQVDEAGKRPKWSGSAAEAYTVRTAGVTQGINVTRFYLGRLESALRAAAQAYDSMEQNATSAMKPWRDRPGDLNEIVEQVLALIVAANVGAARTAYGQQLGTIEVFAKGESVDTSTMDGTTKKWFEHGDAKTKQWLAEHGGELGPVIPNTLLTGDKRGLIPQGLGYDPSTGWILQTNYPKDGGFPTISMIDPATGKEVVDMQLGGTKGGPDRSGLPDHVGGVTSDGTYTYVTSSSPEQLFTYRNSDLKAGGSGPVTPVRPPMSIPAGSYATIKDGNLYVGSFTKDKGTDGKLYRYTSDGDGGWTKDSGFGGGDGYVSTPPQTQGVVVRDGEFVFSSSWGRDKQGRLIVQDRNDASSEAGERGDPYELPNMSEGIIELDGHIIATYESGAENYDRKNTGWWFFGDSGLWANPYMTKTSLSALGLTADFEVSTESLKAAAGDLDAAATPLTKAAGFVEGITVDAADLGEAPGAAALAEALNKGLATSKTSLDNGAGAVRQTASTLTLNAGIYRNRDDLASQMLRPPTLG